jgi:hypothetical protein
MKLTEALRTDDRPRGFPGLKPSRTASEGLGGFVFDLARESVEAGRRRHRRSNRSTWLRPDSTEPNRT